MSFVDCMKHGFRSIFQSCALVWNNRIVFLYVLLGSFIGSVVFSAGSFILGFGGLGLHKLLDKWVQVLHVTEEVYIFLSILVLVVLIVFIKILFEAALIKRVMALLHNKKMSFGKSFDFEKGVGSKLFWWSVIFIVGLTAIVFLRKIFPYDVMHYVVATLLTAWYLGTIFVIPLLIKKNDALLKTLAQSFCLVWRHLVAVVVALFVLAAVVFVVSFFFALIGISLAWLVSYTLSLPSGVGLIVPFIVVALVPMLFLGWYFATVILSVPAVLYHNLMKK